MNRGANPVNRQSLDSQLLQGLRFDPLILAAMFVLSTLTLLFSMIVASRLSGGIDFGPVGPVTARGAGLIAVVTAVNFLDCGIFLAGLIWFLGLMALFHLDIRQTRVLTSVNWTMSVIWKVLFIILLIDPLQ